MTERKYSKALRQSYQLLESGHLQFEDGVKYTIAEAVALTTASDQDIRAIHYVKKQFHGELIIKGVNDGPQRENWRASQRYAAPAAKSPAAPVGAVKMRTRRSIVADATPCELFGRGYAGVDGGVSRVG